MQGGFYQKVFSLQSIEIVVPGATEQAFIHKTYMGELVDGVVRSETRERYIAIARRMQAEQGIQALILGGTELPLLLRDAPDIGMPMLDTARLHVEAAVSACLEEEQA